MKRVLLVVLALVVLAGYASAQDMPAIKSGAKSLNFTFGGFGGFGLTGTGPMGGIGLSYFLSNEGAVRLGLQVSSTSTKTPANPPTGQTGTDGESSSMTVGLGVDYLMYMGSGRVRPYMGGGVGLTFGSNSSKPPVVPAGPQSETKNNPAVGPTGITFGLSGIAGAEFFLYNELSLSAEYRLNIITASSPADMEVTAGNTTTTTKQPSTTTILGFGAAGATVHIYF